MQGQQSPLARRVRAIEAQVRGSQHHDGPARLELPPLTLPVGTSPTDQQAFDGVPAGYVLFLLPSPEQVDENGVPITAETVEWTRIACRNF